MHDCSGFQPIFHFFGRKTECSCILDFLRFRLYHHPKELQDRKLCLFFIQIIHASPHQVYLSVHLLQCVKHRPKHSALSFIYCG